MMNLGGSLNVIRANVNLLLTSALNSYVNTIFVHGNVKEKLGKRVGVFTMCIQLSQILFHDLKYKRKFAQQ